MNNKGSLEHYGVKGMKKPVSPSKLDRVYRVAAGTAALKLKVEAGRKAKEKETADKLKEAAKAQAQQQMMNDNPDDKTDLQLGETTITTLLKKCGTIKVADIG